MAIATQEPPTPETARLAAPSAPLLVKAPADLDGVRNDRLMFKIWLCCAALIAAASVLDLILRR